MAVEIYTFEKADGQPATDWTTQDAQLAEEHGRQYGYNVVANQYEYVDREPVSQWQFATQEEGDDAEG